MMAIFYSHSGDFFSTKAPCGWRHIVPFLVLIVQLKKTLHFTLNVLSTINH